MSIPTKQKPCKGNYLVNYFKGCGRVTFLERGELCKKCIWDWMNETPDGKEYKEKRFMPKARKKLKQIDKQETQKLKDELTPSKAMSTADTYFSQYIRLKYSIDGYCYCYTCNKPLEIKETHNGHYMKREHQATRFHENNCKPQCSTCNGDVKHNGKQIEFKEHLTSEIGNEAVEEIERLSKTAFHTSGAYFREIAEYYRKKRNELQKELGIKYF